MNGRDPRHPNGAPMPFGGVDQTMHSPQGAGLPQGGGPTPSPAQSSSGAPSPTMMSAAAHGAIAQTVMGAPASWTAMGAPVAPAPDLSGHTVLGGPMAMPGTTAMPGSAAWPAVPILNPPPPPQRKSPTALILGASGAVVALLAIAVGVAIFGGGESSDADDEATAGDPPVEVPYGFRGMRGDGYSYAFPASFADLDPATLGGDVLSAHCALGEGNVPTLTIRIKSEPFTGDGRAFGAAKAKELARVATVRRQSGATVGRRTAWDIETEWPTWQPPSVLVERFVTNGTLGYTLTCSASVQAFESQRADCEAVLETFRVD